MNYRNPKLLRLASEVECCTHCGARNHGQVVACHSNSQRHGKGMSQKAHDLPAYLCAECHDLLDGRKGSLTRHEKDVMFLDSAFSSWLWLMQSGHLEVRR